MLFFNIIDRRIIYVYIKHSGYLLSKIFINNTIIHPVKSIIINYVLCLFEYFPFYFHRYIETISFKLLNRLYNRPLENRKLIFKVYYSYITVVNLSTNILFYPI